MPRNAPVAQAELAALLAEAIGLQVGGNRIESLLEFHAGILYGADQRPMFRVRRLKLQLRGKLLDCFNKGFRWNIQIHQYIAQIGNHPHRVEVFLAYFMPIRFELRCKFFTFTQ